MHLKRNYSLLTKHESFVFIIIKEEKGLSLSPYLTIKYDDVYAMGCFVFCVVTIRPSDSQSVNAMQSSKTYHRLCISISSITVSHRCGGARDLSWWLMWCTGLLMEFSSGTLYHITSHSHAHLYDDDDDMEWWNIFSSFCCFSSKWISFTSFSLYSKFLL